MMSGSRWAIRVQVATLTVALAIFLPPLASGAGTYQVLHDFGSNNDGDFPSGPLLRDKRGNLYGATGGGPGQYGYGTVFELTSKPKGTWSEEILHDFAGGSDGAFPDGGLIPDGAGNLFGTVGGDGSVDVGGVFELRPNSGGWSNTILYGDNAGPGLVMDELGDIYGEIGPGDYFHAGAIGELSPGSDGWTYAQLYSFCSQQDCEDGRYPVFPPIWDAHGNLLGTTYYGGIGQPKCPNTFGCGVLFRMTPNSDRTWTYHVLHRFASFPTDGQSPAAGLVMDAAGNLYGNTVWGGANNNGTIFKFTPSAGGRWKQTVLFDFPNCANGCLPAGTLVFDKAGNLYGAASGGVPDCGGYTCGTIFKLAPQKKGKWKYSVVHKFTGKDGSSPVGVILDDKGDIFGTTSNGGTYNSGVAFEITP